MIVSFINIGQSQRNRTDCTIFAFSKIQALPVILPQSGRFAVLFKTEKLICFEIPVEFIKKLLPCIYLHRKCVNPVFFEVSKK